MAHSFTNIRITSLAELSTVSKGAQQSPCEVAAFKYRLAEDNAVLGVFVVLRSLQEVEELGTGLREFMTKCTTEDLSALLLPINQQLHTAYLWMSVHLNRLQVVKLNVTFTMSRTSFGTAAQLKITFSGGSQEAQALDIDRYTLAR